MQVSSGQIRIPTKKAPLPKKVVLDWTDYCNAKCFFCPRESYEKHIGGSGSFIPFEKIKKFATVLKEVEIFCISSAIGEPLLHPELEEILGWLYELNPSIKLQTVTNGTALTASKAGWFAGHLDWLSVSLNAANGEAHMRDMFPHLAKRGIDAQKRWDLHLRHMAEFIAALPPDDRKRIRFQMVTHRDNVKDAVDFVRLVKNLGGTQAGLPNIMVHPDTVDRSLFWIKDQYNDLMEEACSVGAQLGVQVNAGRFFTSVKQILDLDKVCRDPLDVAYVSRSSVGAPCCQWSEQGIEVDTYSDDGFERYWNNEILAKLRQKRDSRSCRVCGMARVFDETSFHFSPYLKKTLVESGKLSEVDNVDDYPDANLVLRCNENQIDLPSIRRTLLRLNLSVDAAKQIAVQGVGALPDLEEACWQAFQNLETPVADDGLDLGGPFLGVGWGPPLYAPENMMSARAISASRGASAFVRVAPGLDHVVRLRIYESRPDRLQTQLQVEICGLPIETGLSSIGDERSVLVGIIPSEVTSRFAGRLWIKVGCVNDNGERLAGTVFLSRLELAQADEAQKAEYRFAIERKMLTAQKLEIAELEKQVAALQARVSELDTLLKATYGSHSWQITAPLRAIRKLAHH
jgi:MoaA/NifB/PqqE/SkfB family radical SAM enzyme